MRFLQRRALVAALGLAFVATVLPPPPLQTPAIAQATLNSYKNDEMAEAATRLEGTLKREIAPNNRPPSVWSRIAADASADGEYRDAVTARAAAAVGDLQNAKLWSDLAAAYLDLAQNISTEAYRSRDRAAAAAYAAYVKAGDANTRAIALARLGEALAAQSRWRPALDAYRASLDLAPDNVTQSIYDDLRSKHGFRIVDYKIDAEAAAPRLCVSFSDPLARDVTDFAPYVQVQGMDAPVVTAEGEQLCLDGLKHGERYEVTVREGVPSAVSEVLQASASYTIYVRDRSPSVRFTGRNYVLPKSGQKGIPVVSVNVDKVGVRLYRVGDRNLAPLIASGDFQKQLYAYELETLESEKGAKVWQGELDVARELNKDVTTAFPIDEAIGKLDPGVYAMVAEPNNVVLDSDADYDTRATQWFVVSDLGLTALNGTDGVTVVVRSLAAATSLEGVDVKLVAKNNEVLGSHASDADGIARFEAGLARGTGGSTPALIVASTKDGNYGFLDLSQSAFDLTDRGVAGRDTPGPLDAYVWTERGVYRPGETVHLAAMLRDANGTAVGDLPLTLVVERPDGVEDRRQLLPDQGMGGRAVDLPIIASAMTGTWRAKLFADPKGAAIGTATFLVEDFVPERLEVDIASKATSFGIAEPTALDLSSRYLYGAPAAGLSVEGDIVVKVAGARAGFPGYHFGVKDDEIEAVREDLDELPALDAEGKAAVPVALPTLPETDQPLEASVTLRVAESGGRAVSRSLTLPVAAARPTIGIRPLFADDRVGENEPARFDVIFVDTEGKRVARQGAKWTLYEVNTNYQWYSSGGRWNYETYKTTRRINSGTIDISADQPTTLEAKVDYGAYRIEVETGGAETTLTSYDFDGGWYTAASADTPDLLPVALDKKDYAVGDTAKVTIEPRFAGRAVVIVGSETVKRSFSVDVKEGQNSLEVPVTDDLGGGAYVIVIHHRPLDIDAGRMPSRAIGLAWLDVDTSSRTLAVDVTAPAEMEPRQPLSIPVKIGGLEPGEEAYVTLAAVDVGILNLTRYEAPAPETWFYQQRKLGLEIRDLYGQLIDGMRANRGAIRSGGDGDAAPIEGTPPVDVPLALFSGILRVAPDGTVATSFDIPAFNGTVRVMAVAWSKGKMGHASKDVIVRDPVVVTATLPRFLTYQDRSTLHVDLHNVAGPAGTYRLEVSVDGPINLPEPERSREISLAAGDKQSLDLSITGSGSGDAVIAVKLAAPDGRLFDKALALKVHPSFPDATRRTVALLAPKTGEIEVPATLLDDFVPGSGVVGLAVTPKGAIDVPALLASLDRYPYGCSEQITSRALPLLYVSELEAASATASDDKLKERINDAIGRLLARQGYDGSFGLWSVGGSDMWLDAYVTEFLSRARERGYIVPDVALTLALDRLKNQLSYISDPDERGSDIAYALYVLARNGRVPMGDLRYYVDEKLDAFKTSIAKAQLGAALALLGDKVRAEKAFSAAIAQLEARGERVSVSDYGSSLRDGAAVLSLASETGTMKSFTPTMASIVEKARAVRSYTSTQENAWMVLAARALVAEGRGIALEVGGEAHIGSLARQMKDVDFALGPIKVLNLGDGPVQATITVTGSPVTPEPEASQGFKLKRTFYDLDGAEVDPSIVRQNTRLVVVLEATEEVPRAGQVLLVDHIPAGFEIDNPKLVDGASMEAFSWLGSAGEDDEEGGSSGNRPTHTEFRDDRFVAAYNRSSDDKTSFSVAYIVRAVSPGSYVLPQATIEDMYRPDRYARTASGRVEVERAP